MKPNKHVERILLIKQCQLDNLSIEETAAKLKYSVRVVTEYWDNIKLFTVEQLSADDTLVKNTNFGTSQAYTTGTEYARERLYGVTSSRYNEMFTAQEGKCKICGIHQSKLNRSLCLDHDHKTLQPRGLLCSKCNLFLGQIKDDIHFLESVVLYLKEAPIAPLLQFNDSE